MLVYLCSPKFWGTRICVYLSIMIFYGGKWFLAWMCFHACILQSCGMLACEYNQVMTSFVSMLRYACMPVFPRSCGKLIY
jgi:hypothetical protein